ncbi:Hypothetical protein SRAE_1000050100 [Strongyloides ratti]|uniref:Uncharacterized protein n=1 Tax=Strongyloides ratti TaxID=34506 RepID=A0A090MUI4_STRRB|nr:Hypothetical protein SRAE_1000050100 [Strongyloides ratti]CEF62228.1 Hypothetical protein SRAE_1000050100 [Strongyloides ratti]
MISYIVFGEGIDTECILQNNCVDNVIYQLKNYGVRFAKTSGEICDTFDQVFDECMGRDCILNELGLCSDEVVFVVREPSYYSDIVYLDDDELLANDLRRYLPSNEYDVDQTTDDTSRLNVNDNNDFSGDFEGRNNENFDGERKNETEERSGDEPREQPPDEPKEEPRNEPTEEPSNEEPESIPDPPKDDDNNTNFDKNKEDSLN